MNMSKRPAEPAAQNLGQIVVTTSIPNNVANAQPQSKQSDAVIPSESTSSAEVGTKSYQINLSGICSSIEQIANTLRENWSSEYDISYSPSDCKHWLNFYLSLRFNNFNSYIEQFMRLADLNLDEFTSIAIKRYKVLLPDSRFNLARVSFRGILHSQKCHRHFSVDQWKILLKEQAYTEMQWLGEDLRPIEEFKIFFNQLSQNNQRNLKSAFLQQTDTSKALERYLQYFELAGVDDLKNNFLDNPRCQHPLLANISTDYQTIAHHISQLQATNKVIFLKGHRHANKWLWQQHNLNCDNLSVNDFIFFIEQFREQSNTPAINNSIIARFLTALFSHSQELITKLSTSLTLMQLFNSSESFQSIITFAAIKIKYDHDQQSANPPAYNLTHDFNVPETIDGGADFTITPPKYDDLIQAAQTFLENQNFIIAARQYCQALSMPNQDINPEVLKKVITIAQQHQTDDVYLRLISLIDCCFSEQMMNWNDHQQPLDVLHQLFEFEHYRQWLCQHTVPQTEWNLDQRLLDKLKLLTCDLMSQPSTLANNARFDRLASLWKSVAEFYNEGSQKWAQAYLQVAKINLYRGIDSTFEDMRQLFHTASYNNVYVDLSTILARIYFEIKCHTTTTLEDCFRYRVVTRNRSLFSLSTTCSHYYTRTPHYRDLGSLLQSNSALEAKARELNIHISPLEFSRDDINAMTQMGQPTYNLRPPAYTSN